MPDRNLCSLAKKGVRAITDFSISLLCINNVLASFLIRVVIQQLTTHVVADHLVSLCCLGHVSVAICQCVWGLVEGVMYSDHSYCDAC